MALELSEEKRLDELLKELGVEDKPEIPLPAKTEPPPPARAAPRVPARMQLFHRGSDIEIVWGWWGWQAGLMAAGLAVAGWLLFRYSTPGGIVLYAVVGVPLAYYILARCLNRTHVLVSRDMISVRHGPLPWPGNTGMEVSSVKEVCTEYHVTTYRLKGGIEVGERTTYEVYTRAHNGRRQYLVGGLAVEEALFIASWIESYLRIERVQVQGRSAPA